MPKLLIFLCGFVVFSVPPATAESWIRVKSPHFTVISNGSEKDAWGVAAGFEQIHAVFSSLYPRFRTDSGAETVVVATKDEKTFEELLPYEKQEASHIGGMFHRGWEKDYVIVRLDFPDQTRNVVYHEYIHKLLHINFTRMPLWLDEGLAEFYGNTEFRDNRAIIGASSPRLGLLRQRPLYALQTILSVNQQSPYYHDEDKVGMFYAESWALAHFLMFGKGMGNGKKMTAYLALLQQQEDTQQGFEEVFGKLGKMEESFEEYVKRYVFPAVETTKPLDIDTSSFTEGPMSLAETDARLGGFFNYMGSAETAREWLTAAITADPQYGLAHENMGFLAFREGDDAVAQKEFDQAVSLGVGSYLALYYQSMLRYQGKMDAESLAKLDAAIRRVLEMNPRFAPALIVRSQIYVKQGKLQDAYNAAVEAQKLEPDRAGYLTHLAAIQLLGHNYPEAVKMASTVAARWTSTDGAEALAVIAEARRLGGIDSTTAEQVREADEMKYAADTTAVEGIVKSVRCEKLRPIEVAIQSGSQEFDFEAGGARGVGFSDTLWYGADHFNPCYHIDGMKAVVRYKPSLGQDAKKEIKWLEIRDDLIPSSLAAHAN